MADAWIKANYKDTMEIEEPDRLEHLIDCILLAARFLITVPQIRGITKAILWSAASIGETMEVVVMETLHKGTRALPTPWRLCYDSDEMAASMVRNGLCPTDVAKWRTKSDAFQELYYLSKLQQPIARDHSECVGSSCVAQKYNMSDGSAVHRCEDGDCGMLHVNLDALKDVLDDGFIGLLSSRGGYDPATMTVEIVSSKISRGYIALSHVWADGLGNPAANSLPRCQLSYLGSIVKQLRQASGDEALLLWIDTMCCPVTSPKHRQHCLLLMRRIYEEANHVLVIDAQLSKLASPELDSVEICAWTMYSG